MYPSSQRLAGGTEVSSLVTLTESQIAIKNLSALFGTILKFMSCRRAPGKPSNLNFPLPFCNIHASVISFGCHVSRINLHV